MKTKRYQGSAWFAVCTIFMVLAWACMAHPTSATTRASNPDVAQIDAFVRTQVERHGIPGLSLALIDGDQIIHLAGYGKADETGRLVTPETPFILASASKPITALAIMQLVEAGKLELDAPVQRYLPAFQVADSTTSQRITVRHLLQHTSGIPEQGCQNSRFGAATLEQFVAELKTIDLATPPGTRYFYCSGNYNILGRIIEVVSGQSFASYIEQHVFVPLQMRHSYTDEQKAQQNGLARGYWWLFGVPVPMEYSYDVPQMPSGFLVASAEDMAHFLLAQLNGGRFGSTSILSPEGIAAMQSPGVVTGTGGTSYGLGWKIGNIGGVPAVFHSGDHPNVHTLAFIEPETRRGAVLLINSQNVLASVGAFTEIENGVAQLLAGQQPAPVSALSLPILYLIVDVVLGGLFVLAVWPLLGVRRWKPRLRWEGRGGQLRTGLWLVQAFGLPLALLIGARLLLQAIGAQSWAEGLLLFPDFGVWLWGISLVMLFTGVSRVILLRRQSAVT